METSGHEITANVLSRRDDCSIYVLLDDHINSYLNSVGELDVTVTVDYYEVDHWKPLEKGSDVVTSIYLVMLILVVA